MNYVSEKTRVLNTLRQRKRGLTAAQLAERLNISGRNSVYAYISSLCKDGHPIQKTPSSDGMKYSYAS